MTDTTPPSFTANTLIADITQESNCDAATVAVAATGGSTVNWGAALAATDLYDTAVDIKYYNAADVNAQGVVAQGATEVTSAVTIFAIGTHTITCVADDGSSASANTTDDFVITVRDNTGPSLTSPGNYTLEAGSSNGVAPSSIGNAAWIFFTY